MNKMTFALVGLLATTLLGMTQTNTVSEATNAIPKSPAKIQEEKFAAVKKAMPAYFSLEADENNTRSMSQIVDDTIKQDSDGWIKIGLVCVIVPPDQIPSTVDFQITSRGQSWKFTEGLKYPIAADGKPIIPNSQKIKNNLEDVERDATHTEPLVDSLSEDVSLDQLKTLAWATHVWIKTDDGFVEVPSAARQKWKLMWNYFELLRTSPSN
jgi:hypothetical protein